MSIETILLESYLWMKKDIINISINSKRLRLQLRQHSMPLKIE
jgi:hypothetical protein